MNEDTTLAEALRALPEPDPPEGLWDGIVRAQEEGRIEEIRKPTTAQPRFRWVHSWVGAWAGVGATAMLALGIWLVMSPTPEPPSVSLEPVVASLVVESQLLEALVRSRPPVPGPTGNVLLIRIADVDARLNDAWVADSGIHGIEPLLRRRVALLHALADLRTRPAIRTRPATRPALRPAVLNGDDR